MKQLYVWLHNEDGTEKTLGSNDLLELNVNMQQQKKSVRVCNVFMRAYSDGKVTVTLERNGEICGRIEVGA